MNVQATILIPLLRQVDEWLKEAVISALDQSVPCEVLVITSPRTPESNRLILAELQYDRPNLMILEREPWMRFAGALNLGFKKAHSSRVGILLSDDWLEPHAVEVSLPHDADIVSGGCAIFGPAGRTQLLPLRRAHSTDEYAQLTLNVDRANYLSHFFLFRREAVLAVGGLDETIGDSPGVDDFDLIWTMLDAGATVAIVEQTLYCCRDHAGERLTTRRKQDMVDTFLKILEKHGADEKLRKRLMREHSVWFGQSMTDVYRNLNAPDVPGALEPLRKVYRQLLPFRLRVAIQEQLIRPWQHRRGRE